MGALSILRSRHSGVGRVALVIGMTCALWVVGPSSARASAQSTAQAIAPVRSESVATWQPYIAEASLRFGVPIAWIKRVMAAESGGRTRRGGAPIRSRVGAIGLMQLMPETWDELRGALGLGADPDDPRDNILAGTAYLRRMYDRFGYPGLFAAYNAGPQRYAAHLATGKPLPAETRAYVAAVTGSGSASGSVPDTTGSASLTTRRAVGLFVSLSTRQPQAAPNPIPDPMAVEPPPPPSPSLFAIAPR